MQKDNEAPEIAPEEHLDQVDFLKMQLLALRLENAALKVELLKSQQAAIQREDADMQKDIQFKYSLGQNDKVDPQTLKIVRG